MNSPKSFLNFKTKLIRVKKKYLELNLLYKKYFNFKLRFTLKSTIFNSIKISYKELNLKLKNKLWNI